MKMIVVRHGETVENAEHILMGQRQGTLSRKGRDQARRLAHKLRNMRIDAIFSSDLRRARDTTREIAKHHKAPVFYSRQLREQNYGIFQGKSLDKFMNNGGASGVGFKPKGGESLADVRARVRKFIKEMYLKYPDKTILVSAHSGVVWSIYSICMDVPLQRLVKKNTRNTGLLAFEIGEKRAKIIEDKMFG